VIGRITRRLVVCAFAVVATSEVVVVAVLNGRLTMKISSLVVERGWQDRLDLHESPWMAGRSLFCVFILPTQGS
jgi:hypothetical protein